MDNLNFEITVDNGHMIMFDLCVYIIRIFPGDSFTLRQVQKILLRPELYLNSTDGVLQLHIKHPTIYETHDFSLSLFHLVKCAKKTRKLSLQ